MSKKYECKRTRRLGLFREAWVTVEAEDEDEAWEKAEDIMHSGDGTLFEWLEDDSGRDNLEEEVAEVHEEGT